ncbi:RNA-binding protein, partial [Actinokineospora sp. PR83]|nr:RNA-binding protein [Actinokineospora sp. PR83]
MAAAGGSTVETAEPLPGAECAVAEPPLWPEVLPDPVRLRLAELGADAVGTLPPVDVPASLRQVARFAPAKRARLGGPTIVAALRAHPGFRTAVVQWAREHRVEAVEPPPEDAVAVATAALLLGEPAAPAHLELVAKRADDGALRAERDAALARVARLEAELAAAKARVAESEGAADRARAESEAELERLRKRLREQGVRLREAKDAAAAAQVSAERAGADVAAEVAALTERVQREHERAESERARAARAEAGAA